MSFELRKRKSWSNESGVSEIIGNILILMITVVLFSSIMAFVNQMPVPELQTKADFAAGISFTESGTAATLTVTHIGGAALLPKNVGVLLDVDGQLRVYQMETDPDFEADTWNTGVQWTKYLTGITLASSVTVTIIDNEKHQAVWTSQVTGGLGGSPPTILQRYLDSNRLTPTPDPVKEGDNFSLFVRIVDLDNDLDVDSVYVNASSIGAGASLAPNEEVSGWYRWDFNDKADDAEAADGKLLIIHAFDLAHHETISSHSIDITILPTDIDYYESDYTFPPLGPSGLPSYLSWPDNGNQQGYGIYGELFTNGTATGEADVSDSRVVFYKDEMVFIRFASMVMTNVLGQNDMVVYDVRTGLAYTPSYVSSSTSTDPFYAYPTGGGAYVFECKFNTTGLPPGAYTCNFFLSDQPAIGSNALKADEAVTITVLQEGSSIDEAFIPTVQIYKDSAHTIPWGTQSNPYAVASSDRFVVYATLKVLNAQVTPPHPTMTELRIKDSAGNSMVYGSSPAGAMISKVWKWTNGTYYYNFTVNLRLNNGDQWSGGTSAYAMWISKFNDTNEGFYTLSKMLFVTGSSGRADMFVGTAGMASGNNNFNTREYLYYVQNNNFFTSKLMAWSDSTPSASTDYACTALAVGDMDGDGDKDAVMGQKMSNALTMYENTLNSYGIWQSGSTLTRPDGATYPVIWLAFGDVTGDGHDDFAYANSNNQIVIYNTTYGSRGWIYYPYTGLGWGTPVQKIALEDMTGDGRADLIVLGGTTSAKLYVYDLKYAYDSSLSSLRATNERFSYFPTSGSGWIYDFDIEDMNNDGRMDILTTGAHTMRSGVNVNYYTLQTGSQTLLNTAAPYDPQMINGTAYPDPMTTRTNSLDGSYVLLNESTSGVSQGKMTAIVKFNTLSALTPDQELRVYAKIGAAGGATPQEVFYMWFSLDGTYYVPVKTISNTTWKYYNYTLPQSAMGKSTVYLKFTDSLVSTASSSVQDQLYLDHVAVYTGTFGGYTASLVTSDTTYTTVRGGSVDGETGTGTYMEVAIAKDTTWQIRRYSGSAWAQMAGYLSISSSSFHPDAHPDINEFDNTASTMFDLIDMNGDGYEDLLVCNYTITGSGITMESTSYVGLYLNLYTGSGIQSWRYYLGRSWIVIGNAGNGMSPPIIDVVLAAKMTELGT